MREVGKTYVFTGEPASQRGRKALVLRGKSSLYKIRWPNGVTSIVAAANLGEEVEPAAPGVDEPCLLCVGTKTVPVFEQDPEREWVSTWVAEKPCPNCGVPGS